MVVLILLAPPEQRTKKQTFLEKPEGLSAPERWGVWGEQVGVLLTSSFFMWKKHAWEGESLWRLEAPKIGDWILWSPGVGLSGA